MGRSLLLQTQRLCTLCDLNKVEDEFLLMSCPRYAHEQFHVLNRYSSKPSISSSSAIQRPAYCSPPATVEVSTSRRFFCINF